MDTSLIFNTLRIEADLEKAAAMSAYMREQFQFLGISSPLRKKICNEFLKSIDKTTVDWSFIFECWEQPEREFQYLALSYLAKLKQILVASDIPNIRKIIISKSWWDSVDALDTIVGDIALRFPKVNDTLLKWSVDKNIWLRRIAIDHQLLRKDKTDTELLEKILKNNFGQNEFFINKAIGWSLRDYSKTNPDWVRNFIKRYGDKMDSLSIREASKYI